MASKFLSVTAFLLLSSEALARAGVQRVQARDGSSPSYPISPDTASPCFWYYDHEEVSSCEEIVDNNFITMEQFLFWNPSLGDRCENLKLEQSYCVESSVVPTPKPQTSSTVRQTSTSKPPTTPTPTPSKTVSSSVKPSSTGNGISTPSPTQPGLTESCAVFHYVNAGDSCQSMLTKYGLTLAQFLVWNKNAGDSCQNLWGDTWYCVRAIGYTPAPTPKTTSTKPPVTPTPTKPTNGITTPSPTQPGLVSTCDKFYKAQKGELCADIVKKHGITLADFTKWNAVGKNCESMWADTWHCVRVIGYKPPTSTVKPTSTTKGNGIATPTPTQPGMIGTCKRFDFVDTGVTCDSLVKKHKITLANFVKWNGLNASCSNLWAKTYACVGV